MFKKLQFLLISVLVVGCLAVSTACSLADPNRTETDDTADRLSSVSGAIEEFRDSLLNDDSIVVETTDDSAVVDIEEHKDADSSRQMLQQVTVTRVVDGDTFLANVDGAEEYIRLIGVDTPESVHPDEDKNTEVGDEASKHTKEILPAGTTVWLETDISDRDQYDRLLRYVWLDYPTDPNNEEEVKAKMLNAILVEDGWATAKTYAPDTKWSDLFGSLM